MIAPSPCSFAHVKGYAAAFLWRGFTPHTFSHWLCEDQKFHEERHLASDATSPQKADLCLVNVGNEHKAGDSRAAVVGSTDKVDESCVGDVSNEDEVAAPCAAVVGRDDEAARVDREDEAANSRDLLAKRHKKGDRRSYFKA